MFKIVLILLPILLSAYNGENLVPDPHITGAKEWNLNASAIFDPQTSLSQGSGSIRLTKVGANWNTTDFATPRFKLPVTPGKIYTLSFKTKTERYPSPLLHVTGAFYGTKGWIQNASATKYANAHTGDWEETVLLIKVPKNPKIRYFRPKILLQPKYSKDGPIWIDDLFFAEGIHFEAPSPKKAFAGSLVKVDDQGNMEIKKGGKWTPFFPIAIYADGNRRDWSIYARQGFNMNMWASSATSIQKAKDVGLYSGLQLSQYILPTNPEWIPQNSVAKMKHFIKTLRKIKEQKLMSSLLFYYFDNEFYTLNDDLSMIVHLIKKMDLDQQGRMHPIYMLNGDYGIARQYNKLSDVTGTYVGGYVFGPDRTLAFITLRNMQFQEQPVLFAQINDGIGPYFRPAVFGAIARGAKGIGFWRDGGSCGPIEKQPWWPQLPRIAREIKRMLPLIRTKCDTDWQARSADEDLIVGTRTLKDTGYLILANPTDRTIHTNITLSHLRYSPKRVLDYFTGKRVATVSGDLFTLTLPPREARVVKLAHE